MKLLTLSKSLKNFYTLTKPLKSNPEMITNFQNY